MDVGLLLTEGTRFLRAQGIATPRLDAEVLLAFVLGKKRVDLLIHPEIEVAPEKVVFFRQLLRKRAEGVPVAYLTGKREFMSLEFQVTPDVLIPRPETELLVEKVLDFLKLQDDHKDHFLVADVGTGSGAIAVSLASYHPRVRVVAIDVAEEALEVARSNARNHGVQDRIEFLCGDLLTPLLAAGEIGKGDVVVANLPYIPTGELAFLPPDVRAEPMVALDGGSDGLDLYRRLLPQAASFLTPGGLLACELGPGQARLLAELLDPQKWSKPLIELDYQGHDRLLTVVRKKN
jgi:release factor glutamine methyltransferase